MLGLAALTASIDALNVRFKLWPLLLSQNDARDFSSCEILLVTYVLVGRQQKVKTCGFGSRYECAVSSPLPSAFNRFNNDVALESISKRGRGAVIE